MDPDLLAALGLTGGVTPQFPDNFQGGAVGFNAPPPDPLAVKGDKLPVFDPNAPRPVPTIPVAPDQPPPDQPPPDQQQTDTAPVAPAPTTQPTPPPDIPPVTPAAPNVPTATVAPTPGVTPNTGGAMAQADPNKAKAVSNLLAALKGVPAIAPPQFQKLNSPAQPKIEQIKGGNLQALLQSLGVPGQAQAKNYTLPPTLGLPTLGNRFQ